LGHSPGVEAMQVWDQLLSAICRPFRYASCPESIGDRLRFTTVKINNGHDDCPAHEPALPHAVAIHASFPAFGELVVAYRACDAAR
jgi:hypothetical protein